MEIIRGDDQNRWVGGESPALQFSFEPPTNPSEVLPDYDYLRPELIESDVIFPGRDPMAVMEEIGTDLANDETITAEDIVIDLQMACGTHLNDTGIAVLLGWAKEEIQRQALYREHAPDKPPRWLMMQELYGIQIDRRHITSTEESA